VTRLLRSRDGWLGASSFLVTAVLLAMGDPATLAPIVSAL